MRFAASGSVDCYKKIEMDQLLQNIIEKDDT